MFCRKIFFYISFKLINRVLIADHFQSSRTSNFSCRCVENTFFCDCTLKKSRSNTESENTNEYILYFNTNEKNFHR